MKKPSSVRWSYLLTQLCKFQSWALTEGLTALKPVLFLQDDPASIPLTATKGREYTTCPSNRCWSFPHIKSGSLLQPYLCLISFKRKPQNCNQWWLQTESNRKIGSNSSENKARCFTFYFFPVIFTFLLVVSFMAAFVHGSLSLWMVRLLAGTCKVPV